MNNTEQVFALRISSWMADEISNRQLAQYGSAFAKIQEAYDADFGHRAKNYKIQFSSVEVAQLKAEAEFGADPRNGWDGSMRVPFKALLRQIEKAVA